MLNCKTTFKRDCKIINLALEYENYTGYEKYAIVTDLSEAELHENYEDQIKCFKPFLILSRAMGLVIMEHHRNDDKFKKRSVRRELQLDWSDDHDGLLSIIASEDFLNLKEKEFEDQLFVDVSRRAFAILTPLQRKYLISHHLHNKTYKEIACESGVNLNTVWKICKRGRSKFIRAFTEMEAAS